MNPQTIYHLLIKDPGIYIIKLFTEYTKDCKTGHFKIFSLSKMGKEQNSGNRKIR